MNLSLSTVVLVSIILLLPTFSFFFLIYKGIRNGYVQRWRRLMYIIDKVHKDKEKYTYYMYIVTYFTLGTIFLTLWILFVFR